VFDEETLQLVTYSVSLDNVEDLTEAIVALNAFRRQNGLKTFG
jgi:hypothetical protein